MACKIANIGTFAFNIDTREVMWNNVLCEMMGFKECQEVTLDDYLLLMNAEDAQKIHLRIDRITKKEITEYNEEYRVTPKGSDKEIWVNAIGKVSPDSNIMYGVIVDITEKKQKVEFLTNMLNDTTLRKQELHKLVGLIRAV